MDSKLRESVEGYCEGLRVQEIVKNWGNSSNPGEENKT